MQLKIRKIHWVLKPPGVYFQKAHDFKTNVDGWFFIIPIQDISSGVGWITSFLSSSLSTITATDDIEIPTMNELTLILIAHKSYEKIDILAFLEFLHKTREFLPVWEIFSLIEKHFLCWRSKVPLRNRAQLVDQKLQLLNNTCFWVLGMNRWHWAHVNSPLISFCELIVRE